MLPSRLRDLLSGMAEDHGREASLGIIFLEDNFPGPKYSSMGDLSGLVPVNGQLTLFFMGPRD